uniref:MADF domain-containing protein n=1 Tax=Steinernema glaseri TaxID=37863 RepID=A0A1I7XXM4_9BILA
DKWEVLREALGTDSEAKRCREVQAVQRAEAVEVTVLAMPKPTPAPNYLDYHPTHNQVAIKAKLYVT